MAQELEKLFLNKVADMPQEVCVNVFLIDLAQLKIICMLVYLRCKHIFSGVYNGVCLSKNLNLRNHTWNVK